jgi:hypothetical protein
MGVACQGASFDRVIGSRVAAGILSEGTGAPKRAEAVLKALVGEPARTMPGVNRHPAHRIDRQAGRAARAVPDRSVHLDRLADVPERPPAALPQFHAFNLAGRSPGG